MGALAGTGTLVRLILRRDRLRIGLWVAGVLAMVLAQGASVTSLYPTRRDLVDAAAAIEGNAAMAALQGPTRALDTLGGRLTWETAVFGAVAMALMAMFAVGRHTRAEEESGRSELVRSAVVGRHAGTAAALVVAAAECVVVGLVAALGFVAMGLGVAGSAALSAGLTGAGLVFAGVTAVVAQVTTTTRATYGLTGAVLGAAYVVRAAGDVGSGALSWLSPLGWVSAMRPFDGDVWPVLVLPVAATGLLVAAAAGLTARRDHGGGLFAARPGPARAAPSLATPVGLAWRLQRGSVIGWSVGMFLGGLAYGSVGQSIDDLVGDKPSLRDFVARSGGDLTASYFATIALLLAVTGSGFAVSSALRVRTDETAGRAEPLLATALSRLRWAGGHLVVAGLGTTAALAAGGLGTGLTYGVAVGDLGQVPRLVGAALVPLPAALVLVGVATVLVGVVPRASGAAWALVAWSAVVAMLGAGLDLPGWLAGISPFDHVGDVPASPPAWGALVALTAVAAVLAALGLAGLRRRDVAS